jgi:uncharacterized protein YjiS (DUF1127 family)
MGRDGKGHAHHADADKTSSSMHGAFNRKAFTRSGPSEHNVEAVPWTVWLELCFARWHERCALRGLSDDQLKDIGLSRADVERERRRWPWDGGAGP